MKSLQHYIDQINQLLNELIQVATQLRDISLQVISEEDLTSLQKRQEDLLAQLENVDQHIQDNYRLQLDSKLKEHFHHQLQTFQQLNQEFIQNLNTSHGLIQFELHRLQEEEDFFSPFPHLKKASSDSAEAGESKEDKES
jgi:flagellar biosynthesis/type III secretory pathway chaperone